MIEGFSLVNFLNTDVSFRQDGNEEQLSNSLELSLNCFWTIERPAESHTRVRAFRFIMRPAHCKSTENYFTTGQP